MSFRRLRQVIAHENAINNPGEAANNMQPSTCNLQRSVCRIAILSLLSSILALGTTGCQVLSYTSPTGEHFTRSTLGTKTSIAHLSVQSSTNGMHKVDLKGYNDDQTEALGVITDAAIKAAISAAKP